MASVNARDGAVRLIGSRSPMQKGVGAPRNLMPRLLTILTSRLNSETAFGPAWSKISSWPACILRRDATHLRRSERTVSPSVSMGILDGVGD